VRLATRGTQSRRELQGAPACDGHHMCGGREDLGGSLLIAGIAADAARRACPGVGDATLGLLDLAVLRRREHVAFARAVLCMLLARRPWRCAWIGRWRAALWYRERKDSTEGSHGQTLLLPLRTAPAQHGTAASGTRRSTGCMEQSTGARRWAAGGLCDRQSGRTAGIPFAARGAAAAQSARGQRKWSRVRRIRARAAAGPWPLAD
jgi:hypothetical protein